jgi:hypothetical protein
MEAALIRYRFTSTSYFCSPGGVRLCFCSTVHPPDDRCMNICGMITKLTTPKYSQQNLSQCYFVHQKPHTVYPGNEPWHPSALHGHTWVFTQRTEIPGTSLADSGCSCANTKKKIYPINRSVPLRERDTLLIIILVSVVPRYRQFTFTDCDYITPSQDEIKQGRPNTSVAQLFRRSNTTLFLPTAMQLRSTNCPNDMGHMN